MYKTEKVATIAERLNEALRIRGKKQIDLVQGTGVNKSTISRYLRGEREPKQTALLKLARVLNVSEAWLLGFDVPMERTPEQKKNDDLVTIVGMLRKNPDLFEMVNLLTQLPAEDYDRVKVIITALLQK